MTLLLDKYYDARVVSSDVDINSQGAVRVNILGITDELKNNEKPWALPAMSSNTAVPTLNTYLRVAFDDGDPNRPKYFDFTPEKTYLPKEYFDNYPHVAVSNLGGDLFIMTHNRDQKNTVITHPSDSEVTWNQFGTLTHDSDKGYVNAGLGANKNEGNKILPVLTEGTIDIFTCLPVGRGSAFQGSEFLKATHISKQTVDALNGLNNKDLDTNLEPAEGNYNPGEFRELGSGVVDFMEAKDFTIPPTNKPRAVSHVLVANTEDYDFNSVSADIFSGREPSVHYLIGQTQYLPKRTPDGSEALDKKAGFLQMVNLTNTASFGSNKFYPTSQQSSANKGAVVIMLIGLERSDYQIQRIIDIKNHIQDNVDAAIENPIPEIDFNTL